MGRYCTEEEGGGEEGKEIGRLCPPLHHSRIGRNDDMRVLKYVILNNFAYDTFSCLGWC